MTKKILVIDDEVEICHIMEEQLTQDGYDVATAGSCLEGLERAKEVKPDLILLDIIMPKLDGFSFLTMIKADEGLKDIPVIMVTANAGLDDVCSVEGAAGYIVKPFKIEDLLSKIIAIIGE